MQFTKKIKGGALQYVLVISIIIAIIIFAFISLVYLQQKMIIKHSFTKEAITNTIMPFSYLKQKEISYNEEITLNLSDTKFSNTTFIKKHWGIFDIGIATSKVKNEYFHKIAILGSQNKKRDALYLKENNSSLVLVGKTKITGNAYLPKLGVKSGNIAGESYYGNQLIYGYKKQSDSQLPQIQNIQYLKNFVKNYAQEDFVTFELVNGLKLHQSFNDKGLLYEDDAPILISNIWLSGHILIVSQKKITVTSTAKLEDVILIAPEIIVEGKTTGSFQAIATKKIEINSNSNLLYPSALVLLNKSNANYGITSQNQKSTNEEFSIVLNENTDVRGLVVYHSENLQSNYDAQIKIEENAKVVGEVYCSKNVQFQGEVFGSIYTNNFIIKKSGDIYVNHIYNGEINANIIPHEFAGLQINQSSNQLAKWVD
ncbi:hypothetical protein [Polaribacter sp. Asnod6-C07]|uniref:hypothetical protein n=1 Tax=Polaribacter sp. Asnod6-C07 TaxID=3160582 RepID=UPI0038680522